MNDDIELLVTRLHEYIDELETPGYSHDDFQCHMIAQHLLFLMYGGVSGSYPVAPALDRERNQRLGRMNSCPSS